MNREGVRVGGCAASITRGRLPIDELWFPTHGSADSKRGSEDLHDRRRVVDRLEGSVCAATRAGTVRDTAGLDGICRFATTRAAG